MNTPTNKLRWGILGTANIARKSLIPALKKSDYAEIAAIASRDLDKAHNFIKTNHLNARGHGSYQALVDDPDIDVLYNPTPNHLHVPLTLDAITVGKHVLCEKPIGLNEADARRLSEALQKNPRVKVMEAFMYRFHSQWTTLQQWIDAGDIGELIHIASTFSYMNTDPKNVRNQSNIGGGALLDIGCYSVSTARFLFKQEPEKVIAEQTIHPDFDTDIHTSGLMKFKRGSASFFCSTQSQRGQGLELVGSQGKIRLSLPFNPEPDKAIELVAETNKGQKTLHLPYEDQYLSQVNAFSRAILNNTEPPIPLTDAFANMRVLDAIKASASNECWVNI